jgi:hypothetical protein
MKTGSRLQCFNRSSGRKKEAGKTIENRTQPELVPNQASKSNIVRGAHMYFPMFIDLIEENFSGIEGGSSDTSPEKKRRRYRKKTARDTGKTTP